MGLGRFAWRSIGVVALAIAAATACGSDPSVPADAAAEADAAPTPTAVPASPLVGAVGLSSDPASRRADLIELQRRAEQSVATCMTAAGFEYEPDLGLLATVTVVDDGTRAWAETYGFGVVAEFESVSAGLASTTPSRNDVYLASLTEDQRALWERTLLGDVAGALPAGQAVAFSPGGCQGAALARIGPDLERHAALADPLDELDQRIRNDPRVAAVDTTWSTCMSGVGLTFARPADAVDEVYGRLLQLEAFGGPAAGQPGAVTPTELLAHERTLAVASFDCAQPHRATLDRVRAAYESEFIEDNQSLLALWSTG